MQLVEFLTSEEKEQIQEAARVRNVLIHSYWDPPHTSAMQTQKGRRWLFEDLDRKRALLRDADRIITRFIDSYLAKYGHSVESLADSLSDEYEPEPPPPPEVFH